jgi:Mrp family chromosome partitioning ATPase
VVLSDAAVVAPQTDGVLLVIDAGRTRRDVARQAVETLRLVNACLIGALMNRVPTRGSGYYYYPHYYYRSYDHGHSGNGRDSISPATGPVSRLGGVLRRKPRSSPPGSPWVALAP